MDDNFALFLKTFGPATYRRPVEQRSFDRYRGILPDQLLMYWEQEGWASYANGLVSIINPEEYEGVVELWLEGTELAAQDEFFAYAMGGFGKLELWGRNLGSGFTINPHLSGIFPGANNPVRMQTHGPDWVMRVAFGTITRTSVDFDSLFDKALKKHGPLAPNEMFGFVPALCLGFEPSLKMVRKEDAVVHLTMLAQLCDRQVFENPYIKAWEQMNKPS